MFLSIVPCPISIHSKRTAARRRDPSSRLSKSERFVAFQVNHSWNNPGAARRQSARAAWGLRLGLGQARGLIQIQHNTRAHTLMATARRFKSKVRRGGIKVIATLLPQRA